MFRVIISIATPGDVIYLGASGNDSVVAVGADDGAIVWRSAAEHGFIDSTPAQVIESNRIESNRIESNRIEWLHRLDARAGHGMDWNGMGFKVTASSTRRPRRTPKTAGSPCTVLYCNVM